MSYRKMGGERVNGQPEESPRDQIVLRTELLTGVKKARGQAKRGEGIPAEEGRKLVDSLARR